MATGAAGTAAEACDLGAVGTAVTAAVREAASQRCRHHGTICRKWLAATPNITPRRPLLELEAPGIRVATVGSTATTTAVVLVVGRTARGEQA
jgi:hypothetical protein